MGPFDEYSKDMRRRLRKKLKEDLIKVQGLVSKIEARAMQLSESHPVTVRPSFSNSQISGNDLTAQGAGCKEVTSQLDPAVNGSFHHAAPLSKQQLFEAGDERAGAELIGSKRIPKVSQVYKRNEFLVDKDKLPSPPVKLNAKLSKSNGQATRALNKRKPTHLPNDSKMHCSNILKKLMGHEDGWIFNEPVDAVKLGLSDYHSVIKRPIDLGTIKGRLEKRHYKSLLEFGDDVKLTFGNAMSYNPPGNDVHQSAKMLLTMFLKDWDTLKEKMSKANGHGEFDALNDSLCQGFYGTQASSDANLLGSKNTSLTKNPLQSQTASASARRIPSGKSRAPMAKSKADTKKRTKDTSTLEAPPKPRITSGSPLAKPKPFSTPKTSRKFEAPSKAKSSTRPIESTEKLAKNLGISTTLTKAKASAAKKAMSYEEKVNLQTLLGQLPQQKLEELIYLMRERIINLSQEDDEIEVDLDSFDDDTLWELQERASECLENLQKNPESRKRPREDNPAGKTGKRQKGLPQVTMEQQGTSGKRSISVSGSSSESGSGDSSTSDSDG